MAAPRLSIAIVNYNSGYRLRQCLDAIRRNAPSCPYEVVVVENASKDGSADFLRDEPRDEVRLVHSPVNLLWTGGINLAARHAVGDYFMILAPDMVPQPGAFDAVVRHFDADATVGGIGGYTVDKSGAFDRYVRRFPTPFEAFIANYFSERAKGGRLLRRFEYGLKDVDFSRPVAVPISAGGCLAVRRSILAARPLNREFGLFWSDTELNQRIWRSGHRVMVFPDARFLHDHDKAPRTVRDESSLLLVLDYLVGCHAYFRMHSGRSAAFQVKVLFGAGALASLLLKHLPKAIVGAESWGLVRARGRVLGNFLRGRNTLLVEARRRVGTQGPEIQGALNGVL